MNSETGKSSRILVLTASLVVAAFLLLSVEIVLRMAGFRYDNRPRYMEFNFPNPHELHEIFEYDPQTYWRLKPGVKMGADIEPINSKGFRGPEFADQKAEGTKRLVTLGDSVTFGGAVSYPSVLADCLDGGWEVINAGVPGYSSFQGKRLFETRITQLVPDVVTVMFGWNDHWLSKNYPDSRQHPEALSELPSVVSFVRNIRIFQLLGYATNKLVSQPDTDNPNAVNRVSTDEYRVFLDNLVDTIQRTGATAVLITAPAALDRGKAPTYLYDLGFVKRIEGESEEEAAQRLRKLHADYNDIVRAVTKEMNVPLVDLESQWYDIGTRGYFRDPWRDVTHPNEKGYRLIGNTLCDTIKTIVVTQTPE